jgi:hypothetical protein
MAIAKIDKKGLVLAFCAFAAAGSAWPAETLEQAIREADFMVDLRLRYKSVDQIGFTETADAVTSRLRAGFETAPVGATTLLVEAVWIEDFVDDYNSTVNGATQFPVVADPADFAAINRFAVTNKSLPNTMLTFGRQRIVIDDARFVGNVGWRQNEQTFDAVRAKFGTKVKADLSYASQVNRIFGPESPAGKWDGDVLLSNVAFTSKAGTITLFDYYLDLDNAAASSTNTVGIKLIGSKPLSGLTASYALGFASQSDAGDNAASFDERYLLVEGGLGFGKATAAFGLEVLGSDGTNAFQTPLATLHAFQGWVDKFLATPAAGLEDRYVRFGYPITKRGPFTNVNLLAFYHDFIAESGSADYGSEIDLQLVARTEKMTLTFKYADYRAEALFTDTDKVWMSVDYAF